MTNKNTRARARRPVEWLVTWSATESNTNGNGTIRDINAAGALLECQSNLSVGEQIQLRFRSPNRSSELVVNCTVIWASKNFFGTEFESLEPEIERYLQIAFGSWFCT